MCRVRRFYPRLAQQEVECLVSAEGRWAYELSLRPSRYAASGAGDLLTDYWRLRGYQDSGHGAV